MKRKIAMFAILFAVVLTVPLTFVACGGSTVDGIKLSKIKYVEKPSYDQPNPNYTYQDLTFSCTVKNTTKETLAFKVEFSARYSGVFGKTESEFVSIVLEPGEKRDLEYTRKNAGDQIYMKRIAIVDVKPAE